MLQYYAQLKHTYIQPYDIFSLKSRNPHNFCRITPRYSERAPLQQCLFFI